MTVDPERLKVAMEAAEKHIYKNYNRVMHSSEGGASPSRPTSRTTAMPPETLAEVKAGDEVVTKQNHRRQK